MAKLLKQSPRRPVPRSLKLSSQPGETDELALLDLVSQNRCAPGRTRPFAIQSVDLTPMGSSPPAPRIC